MITHTKLQTKFYGQEHLSLKVPNIEFNFDVSVDSYSGEQLHRNQI